MIRAGINILTSNISRHITAYEYAIIFAMFVLSRICVRLAGIEFESQAHRWCYQYLPPHLLTTSFLKSLFYLHMQPPFFNFLIGIGYKIFGKYDNVYFNTLFLLFSLLSIFCFCACLKRIDIPILVRFFAVLLLLASPSLILFENILFYSVFVFFMFFVMLFALCSFSKSHNTIKRFRFLCLFSFSALLLMLTRSLFHIIWFLMIAIGFFLLAYRQKFAVVARKYFFLAFSPVFLIVLVVMVKNYLLFGVFQTSSWFGMNLSRAALESIPLEKVEELYRKGTVSQFSLIVKKYKIPFHFLDKYGMKPGDIGGTQKHPSLLWYLNSIEYIYISKQLAKDSLNIIMAEPFTYLKTVYKASKLFFCPTTEHIRSFPDQYLYNRIWKPLYYPFNSNIIQIIAYVFVVIISGSYTIIALFSKKGRRLRYCYLAWFIFFTLTSFFFVATMFEFGENNRFRFEVLPLVIFGIPWSYTALQDMRNIKQYYSIKPCFLP